MVTCCYICRHATLASAAMSRNAPTRHVRRPQVYDNLAYGNMYSSSCSGGNGIGYNQCCGTSSGVCSPKGGTSICSLSINITSIASCKPQPVVRPPPPRPPPPQPPSPPPRPPPTPAPTCVYCNRFFGTDPNGCYRHGGAGCLRVQCTRAGAPPGSQVVTVDTSACNTGTLGWACCRSSSCGRVSCGAGGRPDTDNSFTCDNTVTFSYTVPLHMTLMPLQVGWWAEPSGAELCKKQNRSLR